MELDDLVGDTARIFKDNRTYVRGGTPLKKPLITGPWGSQAVHGIGPGGRGCVDVRHGETSIAKVLQTGCAEHLKPCRDRRAELVFLKTDGLLGIGEKVAQVINGAAKIVLALA